MEPILRLFEVNSGLSGREVSVYDCYTRHCTILLELSFTGSAAESLSVYADWVRYRLASRLRISPGRIVVALLPDETPHPLLAITFYGTFTFLPFCALLFFAFIKYVFFFPSLTPIFPHFSDSEEREEKVYPRNDFLLAKERGGREYREQSSFISHGEALDILNFKLGEL